MSRGWARAHGGDHGRWSRRAFPSAVLEVGGASPSLSSSVCNAGMTALIRPRSRSGTPVPSRCCGRPVPQHHSLTTPSFPGVCSRPHKAF